MKITGRSFLLSIVVCKKIDLFYEKCQMSSCTTCRIRNSDIRKLQTFWKNSNIFSNRTCFCFSQIRKISTTIRWTHRSTVGLLCSQKMYWQYLRRNIQSTSWCFGWTKAMVTLSIFSLKIGLELHKKLWVERTKLHCPATAGAVEYTDCFSAEGLRAHPPPPTSILDMTLNNMMGEIPVMLGHWGMRSTPFIAIAPRSTLARSGCT